MRQFPEEYNEESSNKFLYHVINDYALEKKGPKGEATGIFKMDRKQTEAVSRETLKKLKKLDDK